MKKFCIFVGVVLAGICWLAFSVMDFDGLPDRSSRHLHSARAIIDVLDKGGSVNTILPGLIDNHERDSLIHGAIYYDEPELFRELMRRHADIKIRDESGRTPLIYAALFNRHEMVKMLLEAGADPNERDYSKQTALHWVAQNGGKESAELLLSYGADMYALDYEGKIPAPANPVFHRFGSHQNPGFYRTLKILALYLFPHRRYVAVIPLADLGTPISRLALQKPKAFRNRKLHEYDYL
jgi:hypothetical protein